MKKYLPLFFFSLLGLTACDALRQGMNSEVEYTQLNYAEAEELLYAKQGQPDFLILDVRTPAEAAQGQVPEAVNLDFHRSDFMAQIKRLDRHQTYFVYCQSGYRSAKTASRMVQLGFTEVFNLTAGLAQGIPHPKAKATKTTP